MAALLHRVQFTEQVFLPLPVLTEPVKACDERSCPCQQIEAAMKAGDLSAARISVQARSTASIMTLRSALPKAMRSQVLKLTTLFKEQLDVVTEMILAGERAADIWKSEMRFYVQVDCGAGWLAG